MNNSIVPKLDSTDSFCVHTKETKKFDTLQDLGIVARVFVSLFHITPLLLCQHIFSKLKPNLLKSK